MALSRGRSSQPNHNTTYLTQDTRAQKVGR